MNGSFLVVAFFERSKQAWGHFHSQLVFISRLKLFYKDSNAQEKCLCLLSVRFLVFNETKSAVANRCFLNEHLNFTMAIAMNRVLLF
jgi:hypothetical protein